MNDVIDVPPPIIKDNNIVFSCASWKKKTSPSKFL